MKKIITRFLNSDIFKYSFYALIGIFGLVYFPFMILALIFRTLYRIFIFPIRQKNNEILIYGKIQEYFKFRW
jgi:hypothetical protein